MNELISAFTERVLDTVFPGGIYCICCGDSLEEASGHGLCAKCVEKMPWAPENPFRKYMEEFAFDELYPCLRYGLHSRRIMNALKNGGRPYLARNVAYSLVERLSIEEELPDFLVAVPSHPSKMLRRGYNQAELLAHYTAGLAGLDYVRGALIKTENTASMRLADARKRRSMLAKSFAVSEEFKEKCAGGFVCLVDDVVTTGSTADACARVLKEAGAEKVCVLCYAASSGYRKPEE
ncbi:MAG: ComF family protein [Clostridiales bacterium]|nr:ComF family protein [Clostridiales bacterium]